jgi:DNA ligase-associated metallophosphoesterase
MPQSNDIHWNGLDLTLDADRAAFACESRDLLIADVHVGKAAAFRAGACPVPEAVTDADLGRLTALLVRYDPARLIVLGDLLHAREANSPATLGAVRQWRTRHSLPILLVRGNHDIRAGNPPSDLAIECVDPPFAFGPVDLDHRPPSAPDRPTIAGHVHPGITLRARVGLPMRSRCFHFAERVAVLPAFGEFTGTESIRPRRADRVFAISERGILEVSSAAAHAHDALRPQFTEPKGPTSARDTIAR